jgi:hypothetical protein
MSFDSLNKDELFTTAVEDFGVDVKKTDSKETIKAALLEDGVTWADYLKAHPEAAATAEEVPVITDEVPVAVVKPVVRTATPQVNTSLPDAYLVKMDRDNPYFEYRGYKFTSTHPFVVMPAADADAILRDEQGFAIATPSEAQEYYA